MATLYVCDRCKKDSRISSFLNQVTTQPSDITFELCDTCWDEFRNWVNRGVATYLPKNSNG